MYLPFDLFPLFAYTFRQMKVAVVARSTLFSVQGGITVQVLETAKHLKQSGIHVNIHLAHERIDYNNYDLLHFFDLIRPANYLHHARQCKQPFVITPALIDYSEYDKHIRAGLSGFLFRQFSSGFNEYLKTISRWVLNNDSLPAKSYLWRGHEYSVRYLLHRAAALLPNSQMEKEILLRKYKPDKPLFVVPNGIADEFLVAPLPDSRDEKLVVCAARIEGLKNQLNLIKALNHTEYRLILAGKSSPNQKNYYHQCRRMAAPNIEFIGQLPQKELARLYQKAAVHALPSWFETCGLSSLEAAAMGCRIVISDRGFVRDYFGNDAHYCDPGNPESIYQAVKKASENKAPENLRIKIFQEYTWSKAAEKTLEAYRAVLAK